MRNLLTIAALLVLAGMPATATVIDTTPFWNGTDYAEPFGNDTHETSGTATYGQTITVPLNESTLGSFTFYINMDPSVVFRGYVYGWNGTRATSELWSSGDMSTLHGNGFEKITFNTGELSLKPGNMYVLFASVSETPGIGQGQFAHTFSDSYSGGSWVWQSTGYDPALWTTKNWRNDWGDLVFEAHFVPEPGTLILLGTGLASLAVYARRRRQQV